MNPDLEATCNILMMRTEERTKLGEEAYFIHQYNVEVENLSDIFNGSLENLREQFPEREKEDWFFTLCTVFYEIGRTQEQIIQDGVSQE